jgi:hypothetical protein
MTYDARERSVQDGSPVELIEISYGASFWRYTNNESSITLNGNVFIPVPYQHDDIQPTSDIGKDEIGIQLPESITLTNIFKIHPPSEIVRVQMWQQHRLDGEFYVIWKGRILGGKIESPWLSLTSSSIFSSMKRMGLRRTYGTQCPYVLYGPDCKVSRELYRNELQLNYINGLELQFNGAIGLGANGVFAGGYLTWENADAGNQETRMIVASSTATGTLTVDTVPVGLTTGMIVEAYPGCDHNSETGCVGFNNVLNYGGFPFEPKKNPFDGSTLY